MEHASIVNIMVIWRGQQLHVEMDPAATVKDFGVKLQKLTNVKPDTLRLIVPHSKGSKLITPFSIDHSNLSLQESYLTEGKAIRMMGVFDNEIEEVSYNSSKPDLRIAGFDEGEKRMRQRLGRPATPLQLPKGLYIFCDFRTLHIPGIELNPPASEALKRMHMLACDPGIIGIMNKHRWRVGIMTEMAPVGYVGISPRCILGLNKNQGEEISLRLRTDDLKGFRKYDSIKKTLLHELAHMVYSEHDADFYALDKQLNQEAFSLDWTKSRSHTLSGCKVKNSYEEEEGIPIGKSSNMSGQKLGGTSNALATARAASVAAAYHRFLNASTRDLEGVTEDSECTSDLTKNENNSIMKDLEIEPDPDGNELKIDAGTACSDPEHHSVDADNMLDPTMDYEHNVDEFFDHEKMQEPEPDDSSVVDPASFSEEPYPDDSILRKTDPNLYVSAEPDPDDSESAGKMEAGKNFKVPDPDTATKEVDLVDTEKMELDSVSPQSMNSMKAGPNPDDSLNGLENQELRIIEESVAAICSRIQRAIEMLQSEASPAEATSALQTLFKIIRNVIDHPNDLKFRRLRKANPLFQRNVANYKAAMEVLTLIGFCEDVISDEVGREEAYLILKRDDPGLLWLTKSSLEVSIA